MGKTYYRGLSHLTQEPGKWGIAERWADVEDALHLRPEDSVLDIGCAEGLISFEVAKSVREVVGIDIESSRIATARKLQTERGVTNVRFEAGSIFDIKLEPQSFDVVLFLGAIYRLPVELRQPALGIALEAARRQTIIRTRLDRFPEAIDEIRRRSSELGFDLEHIEPTENQKQARHHRPGDILVATRQQSHASPGDSKQ